MTEQKDIYVNISEPLEIVRRLVEWAKQSPDAALLISNAIAHAARMGLTTAPEVFPHR